LTEASNEGQFVRGDMEDSPFMDGAFDSLYIQDIHASNSNLTDIIRTVKPNGIVIFSKDDCVGGDLDDLNKLRKHPQLNEVRLPYQSGMFDVFQKREAHAQPQK